MAKLIRLEWKKLNQAMVIGEIFVYPLIIMLFALLYLSEIMPEYGQSYAAFIKLNLAIQMGTVIFGASLINQVFIEEYKNETMALSFGYPFSRQKLFTAKILFIGIFVFFLTFFSFLLTGVFIYVLDQTQSLINGVPTQAELITFFSRMIVHSLMVTLISFIPLFFLGIWQRLTVPTVICAFVVMSSSYLVPMLNLNFDVALLVLCVLGVLSIILSIVTAGFIGEA